MQERQETKPWTYFFPDVYPWLDQVKLAKADGLSPGMCHVTTLQKNHDGNLTIDAPGLAADISERILNECKTIGWKGKPSSFRVRIDDKLFLLVVAPSLETTPIQKARQIGMQAAADLRDGMMTDVVLLSSKNLPALDMLEGLLTGFYDSGFFKSPRKPLELPKQILMAGSNPSQDELRERVSMAKAVVMSRMLQDAPGNWLDSERFAAVAEDVLKGTSARVTTYGREELKRLGMGAFLSVAAGSVRDPKMIVVEIDGVSRDRTVALVGKGVTFDSGGISLKPGSGMEDMKYDMSGAAAVFGASLYFAHHKPPMNVVCLIGAVENMPSGTATRPGDIVQSHSGKTIEVLNTDAEGRLVLCDVMSYAIQKYKPDMLLDIATLTGAVMHGLGHAGAGYMCNDEKMATFVAKVGAASGEPLWRLPLWPELAKETKGDVADLKNIAKSNVLAGTIMGGHFLREFVEESKTPWAHVDIAGTGWCCAATGYPSSGGSAFGLRTLVRACQEWGR